MFLKLSKLSSTGCVGGLGGGEQQASRSVTKQAEEFPQVLASQLWCLHVIAGS